MPSAPGPVARRQEAERSTARREYESFDNYEEFTKVLAAGGAFQELCTFSGMPETVTVFCSNTDLFYRLRNPGEAPSSQFFVKQNEFHRLPVGSRIVEVRDFGGVGGMTTVARALFASRAVDRRTSRRGPLASDVRAREQGPPEQLEPR